MIVVIKEIGHPVGKSLGSFGNPPVLRPKTGTKTHSKQTNKIIAVYRGHQDKKDKQNDCRKK